MGPVNIFSGTILSRVLCIVLCVTGMLFQASGQGDAAVTVTIVEGETKVAEKDTKLDLTCRGSRTVAMPPLPFLTTHIVQWWKEQRVPELANKTILLSEQGNLMAHPDHYSLNVPLSPTSTVTQITAILTINEVMYSDDGRYVCRILKKSDNTIVGQDSIDVTVHSDTEVMQLQVDNKTVATVNYSVTPRVTPSTLTKVTEGRHDVHCIGNGSNPARGTKIVFRQNEIDGVPNVTFMSSLSQSIQAPRYSVREAAIMEVTKADAGTTLTCRGGPRELSTTLDVVDWPVILCINITVPVTQTDVRLTCNIRHTDVKLINAIWEFEPTINISASGSKQNSMTTEVVSAAESRLILTLHSERWREGVLTFKLIAVTEVGDVSQNVFFTTVTNDDTTDETDNSGDEGGITIDEGGDNDDNTEATNSANEKGAAGSSRMFPSLLVAMLLFTQAMLIFEL